MKELLQKIITFQDKKLQKEINDLSKKGNVVLADIVRTKKNKANKKADEIAKRF